MTSRESIEQWARRGRGPIARLVRRAATSAVGTYAAYVGYGLLHRELLQASRGADADRPLPGDDLVAAPETIKTFGIDIAAPADAVWPFLVQMGYGRGGWYGWYPMENGGRGSADVPLDVWQDLAVGDLVPDGPDADDGFGVWRVVELEPASAMVLYSLRVAVTGRELAEDEPCHEPAIECSWVFVLTPSPSGCRLIVRARARFLAMPASLLGRAMRGLFDTGDTVMEWTMVQGIKARAEHLVAAQGLRGVGVDAGHAPRNDLRS